MARLKIDFVERTEDRQLASGRAVRVMFCRGEVDDRPADFAVQLWSRDGGESFVGQEKAVVGAVVSGREPRNERFRMDRGMPVYDWVPSGAPRSLERGAMAGAVSGLAAVAREWLAAWLVDRREARELERARFEFERRARVIELTLSALGQSHKETAEFNSVRAWVEKMLG